MHPASDISKKRGSVEAWKRGGVEESRPGPAPISDPPKALSADPRKYAFYIHVKSKDTYLYHTSTCLQRPLRVDLNPFGHRVCVLVFARRLGAQTGLASAEHIMAKKIRNT